MPEEAMGRSGWNILDEEGMDNKDCQKGRKNKWTGEVMWQADLPLTTPAASVTEGLPMEQGVELMVLGGGG